MNFLIVDHVGIKSGMDLYTINMAKGINEKNNCYVFSNFYHKDSKYKKLLSDKSHKNIFEILKEIFKYLIIVFKSYFFKTEITIVHQFSSNFASLILPMIMKLNKGKLLIIYHDINSFHGTDSSILKYFLTNFLADFLVVHNEYSKNELLASCKINKKIIIMPHGVNLPENQDSNLVKQKNQILFFGQIKQVKGLDVLLKAIPLINNSISIVIAGSDSDQLVDEYQEKFKDTFNLKNVSYFFRFIKEDEKEKLFLESKLLVLPYKEIFQSGVFFTSIGYKLPILASDLNFFKKNISHEKTGLLFKNQSHIDLANKINQMDKYDLPLIAKNAYKYHKKKYNWSTITKNLVKDITNYD